MTPEAYEEKIKSLEATIEGMKSAMSKLTSQLDAALTAMDNWRELIEELAAEAGLLDD